MTLEELIAKLREEGKEDEAKVIETKLESLNGEAAKYRKSAAERKDALALLEGLDPAEFKRLKDADTLREEEKLKDAGKFDEILKNAKADSQTQLDKMKEYGDGWKNRYEAKFVEATLINAAVVGKAISPKEVASLTRSMVKLGESGEIEVFDEAGKPALNEKGEKVTVDGMVSGWLKAHPHHVSASGGGAGSSNGGEGGGSGKTIDKGQIGSNLEAVAKGEVTVTQ